MQGKCCPNLKAPPPPPPKQQTNKQTNGEKWRNMCPRCARKKHLLRKQNVSEKSSETLSVFWNKKCTQTGRETGQGSRQCFRKCLLTLELCEPTTIDRSCWKGFASSSQFHLFYSAATEIPRTDLFGRCTPIPHPANQCWIFNGQFKPNEIQHC